MATTNSLKDLLNWKKYFKKHKPSLLMKIEKLDQFLKDIDLYIEAKRIEGLKERLTINLKKETTADG